MEKSTALTAALEDYLEAILHLCRLDKAARSRDIAEALNVHKSTVTAALKSLGHMELINYSPYEAVTLTPKGQKLAEDVANRHSALKNFFVDVLKVDESMAETAACGMEHSVPREIVEKLASFAVLLRNCPRLMNIGSKEVVPGPAANACCGCGDHPAEAIEPAGNRMTTLDTVRPGESVTVLSVKATGSTRKRLVDMGFIRGTKVTVERVAPMGDPLDLRIKGYRLSVRKDEAGHISVEKT